MVSAFSLPRDRRGAVLRPVAFLNGWWVYDDLGPLDGPHDSLDAAWSRIEELDCIAADERHPLPNIEWYAPNLGRVID